jgi:[acyl-carrier-protein] S-malonyltransferase
MVSNISARLLTTAEQVRHELASQTTAAVQWARCVLAMGDHGAGLFVEVGPGQALTKLVRRIDSNARAVGTEGASEDEILSLADSELVPIGAPAR